MNFDREYYIERNRQVAIEMYGDKLTEDRKVKGTNIWFDHCWRYHEGKQEE